MEILKILAAIGTILVGAVSMFLPTKIKGFTGLDVEGNPRGITEVRAVLGAFFVGLGLAPLLWRTQSEPMYIMLGFTYLVVAAVRIVSMVMDKSVMRSNIISAVSEVILGVILVLPG